MGEYEDRSTGTNRKKNRRPKKGRQGPDFASRVEAENAGRASGRNNWHRRSRQQPPANQPNRPSENRNISSIADRLADPLSERFTTRYDNKKTKRRFGSRRSAWQVPPPPSPDVPKLVCATCAAPIEDYVQAIGDAS